jgi:hypothetical protein
MIQDRDEAEDRAKAKVEARPDEGSIRLANKSNYDR